MFPKTKTPEPAPPDEKCPECGEVIAAEYSTEYGWNYQCEKCEINWGIIT
jgi:hypothetical protein